MKTDLLANAPFLAAAAILAQRSRSSPVSAMGEGVREGLRTVLRMFPPVAVILTAAAMLRASGALDALSALLAPGLSRLGIPPEAAGLMLIRPHSGSGAMAFGAELIRSAGPDSLTGRIAAVMLGSTETTFYVISVYFGAAGIKRGGYAIPAALIADLTGFLAAAAAVRLGL